MSQLPEWIQRARSHWRYRGQERPSFAEVPKESQESVWDYPRPPRIESDSRSVRVFWGDLKIAESTQTLRVLETASPPTFYVPATDVQTALLSQQQGTSFCEWKGAATYWLITASSGTTLANAVWSYDRPLPGFEAIAEHFAFYPGKLHCEVDGIQVKPQPGNLYGGWVTPEIVGPMKGSPGTGSW